MALELLREYLVQVSEQRLMAYRRYREESFEYLSVRKLEVWHWQALYAMVTLETLAFDKEWRRQQRQKYVEQCSSQRVQLCEAVGIAEERLPLEVLTEFWQRHHRYARLPLEYPEASVVRDALPWSLVEAYRGTFDRAALPATVYDCTRGSGYQNSGRAQQVASSAGLVALPRVCGDAALVAAYAMLKCEVLLEGICWYGSRLTPVQRCLSGEYPKVDFDVFGSRMVAGPPVYLAGPSFSMMITFARPYTRGAGPHRSPIS